MTNIKTLFVGAVAGIVATVAGAQLAHADCDYPAHPATEREAIQGYPDCDAPVGYSRASQAGSWPDARADADTCDTNYAEVVRSYDGWEAYCVPDDVAEGCIDVSSLLDCSLMSAGACDDAMGRMFEACLTLQAAGGR